PGYFDGTDGPTLFFCESAGLVLRALPGEGGAAGPEGAGFHCPSVSTAMLLADVLDHVSSTRGTCRSDVSFFMEMATSPEAVKRVAVPSGAQQTGQSPSPPQT